MCRKKRDRNGTVSEELSAMAEDIAGMNKTIGKIMAAQDDINAATAEFTTLLGDLQTQTASLVTDLTALQTTIASGQPVDTSALDAAVASAAGVQQALDTAVGSINTTATPPASS